MHISRVISLKLACGEKQQLALVEEINLSRHKVPPPQGTNTMSPHSYRILRTEYHDKYQHHKKP